MNDGRRARQRSAPSSGRMPGKAMVAPAPRRPAGAGQDGSIQVFEAFLVAILVFTALIFFAAAQRPTTGKEALGVDLARIAGDNLDILQTREFEDPHNASRTLAFAGWFNLTVAGDTDMKDDVHAFLEKVLPAGTRYVMRLGNGEGVVAVLPPGTPPDPRAGRGSQAFFVPNWTTFAARTHLPATTQVHPGAALDFSSWTSLVSPNNATKGPDGTAWLAWWDANEPVGTTPEKSAVPPAVLLGTWKYTAPGACSTGCYVHVSSEGGPRLDRPVYAVEMLVWFGA